MSNFPPQLNSPLQPNSTPHYNFTILCQLNGGCFGCCGHDFGTKEELKKALEENITELKLINPKTELELLQFRDRFPVLDLKYGLCHNLIQKEAQFICPLHPAQNKGKDLRVGHCDINYLCPTAQAFARWDEAQQKQFLIFIEQQKLDNIDYSLKMDNHSLMKEFEKIY